MSPVGVVPTDEKILISKARQGDKHAYGVLVPRYEKKIFSVVYSLLRNKEDAEDVTQEVFVRAYFSLKNYREDSAFYTWLYRIAYNMSIDFKRRVAARIQTVDPLPADSKEPLNFLAAGDVQTPEAIVEQRQLSQSLQAALAEISEEHRAVVIFREVDGLSYDEIASLTGSARGTVMSRLHYARKHLQKRLKETFLKQSQESEVPDAKVGLGVMNLISFLF
jgi:RNA polymerase sigma-70 factor (ECF subfamily)